MKKLTLILLVVCSTLSAQNSDSIFVDTAKYGTWFKSFYDGKYNAEDFKYYHEDKNTSFEPIYYESNLSGCLIEIDGHTFLNDTCDCPIIYKATLDKITITDCNGKEYDHRICGEKGCEIIHLEKQVEIIRLGKRDIKFDSSRFPHGDSGGIIDDNGNLIPRFEFCKPKYHETIQ